MLVQKLALYGAGKRCRTLCKVLKQTSIEIVAIIDSSADKWGKEIEGYPIQSPEILKELRNVNLCITLGESYDLRTVRDELQQVYQYDLAKEIHYYKLILDLYIEDSEIKQKLMCQSRKKKTKRKL